MWLQPRVSRLLSPICCGTRCSSNTVGPSKGIAGKARGCWPCSLMRLIISFPTELGRRAQKSNCVFPLSFWEENGGSSLDSWEKLIIAFLTELCLKRKRRCHLNTVEGRKADTSLRIPKKYPYAGPFCSGYRISTGCTAGERTWQMGNGTWIKSRELDQSKETPGKF